MAAYVIANLRVRQTTWREDYAEKTLALICKHGGKVLSPFGSKVEALELFDEEARTVPSTIVMLEFPSARQARQWYHDSEYAPLIALRKTGADGDLLLVDAG